MTDDASAFAKSLREEVQHLLGLRWDRFVEWIVIGWLSAWFWTSCFVANRLEFPAVGPIAWIADCLDALDVPPPAWLTGIPIWLSDPARSWLGGVFVAAAAIAATFAVRSWKHTGLRVIALVGAVLAVETTGSALSLLAITVLPIIPAGLAAAVGAVRDRLPRGQEGSSFYSPPIVVELYLARVALLFVAPLLAPLVLATGLVRSFKMERPYRPAEELARRAARALHEDGRQRLADADVSTVASVFVAALTGSGDPNAAREVAARFERERDQPIGARTLNSVGSTH